MKKIITFAVATLAAVALSYTASAIPITGNIGFAGTATLDSGSVATATKVVSWGTNTVDSESGAFSTFVPIGSQVSLAAPWVFNTPLPGINSFWSVGGFTYNLLTSVSSVTTVNGTAFLDIAITGTIGGNGFSTTPFDGEFSTQNPSANGATTFTESFSFTPGPVPDGGITALLLGLALSTLAVIKRRIIA